LNPNIFHALAPHGAWCQSMKNVGIQDLTP
jgi:hypothetical protein